jgi:hypothetical protein
MLRDLAQCPDCRHWILLPELQAAATLVCPWCDKQHELGGLSLVTAREAEATPQTASDEAPLPVIETAGPGVAPTPRRAEVPSPFQGPPTTSVARQWATARRRPGMTVEIIKIVAGGLAGLALAQLMLWWIPAFGHRDPLGVAPLVPDSASWVLPPRLRPLPDWPPPAQPLPELRELPSTQTAEANLAEPPPPVAAAVESPATAAPIYSGAQLQQALARVVTAMDQLERSDAAPRDERLKLARNLYQRLCDVAQTAGHVDLDDRQLGQRMNATAALLERVASRESLRNLVGRTSADWLNFPARTSDGIALAGEVIQIEPKGRYWETELRLASRSDQTVRVLTDILPQLDPRMPFDVGCRLLVLGTIVQEPAQQLTGYDGPGPVVHCVLHQLWPEHDQSEPSRSRNREEPGDIDRKPLPAESQADQPLEDQVGDRSGDN